MRHLPSDVLGYLKGKNAYRFEIEVYRFGFKICESALVFRADSKEMADKIANDWWKEQINNIPGNKNGIRAEMKLVTNRELTIKEQMIIDKMLEIAPNKMLTPISPEWDEISAYKKSLG